MSVAGDSMLLVIDTHLLGSFLEVLICIGQGELRDKLWKKGKDVVGITMYIYSENHDVSPTT
jgi:hypothetical protein